MTPLGAIRLDDKSANLDVGEQRNANPDRLPTFSDGVLATIITILALEAG